MAHERILACCWAALGALSVGCGDHNVYAMSERYEVDGDTRSYAGGGCMRAIPHGLGSGGSTSAGGGLPGIKSDFTIAEHSDGDSFIVVVTSQDEEIARREYGEKELLSGKRDEFTVTTKAGRTFELAYWGGHECDTSHLQHEDP